MAIADTSNSIFAPPVGTRPRMVMRKIVPRIPICAVVFADRSPLPRGEIRPPALPMHVSFGAGEQALLFVRHSWASLQKEICRVRRGVIGHASELVKNFNDKRIA